MRARCLELIVRSLMAAVLLLINLHAWALDAEKELAKLMKAQYGSYVAGKDGWKSSVEDDGYVMEGFTLFVTQQQKVAITGGERLYVFVSGNYTAEKYPSHATAGFVGAFVLEEKEGKVRLVASNKYIRAGSNGLAPGEVKLERFGPEDYYGWIYLERWFGQGQSIDAHVVLLPRGKKVAELAMVRSHADNFGVYDCEGKKPHKGCRSLDYELRIDASRSDLKVYPLVVTRTGMRDGKKLAARTWRIDFDERKWRYPIPEVLKEQ